MKGFRAINLFGIIFARSDEAKLTDEIIFHERIHTRQMLELMIIGFYLWYIIEWLIKWAIYKNRYVAYKNIGFEKEAYENHNNKTYLKQRRWYKFVTYL